MHGNKLHISNRAFLRNEQLYITLETSKEIQSKRDRKKGRHNTLQSYSEYSTRIKDPGVLTVYPHVVIVPRSFEITERGRKPRSLVRLLISLNCIVSFKKPINGWVVNGENVVLT